MKQNYVSNHVIAYCPMYNFICDQIISGGHSRRKPDMLLRLSTHSIIVEIDENMHRSPSYQHETGRIMEMFDDLKHKPLVVLRLNPDEYINTLGQRIRALFAFDAKNTISIIDQNDFNLRTDSLVNRIRYYAVTIPEKELVIEKLFYSSQ